jgi:hypothetical protein
VSAKFTFVFIKLFAMSYVPLHQTCIVSYVPLLLYNLYKSYYERVAWIYMLTTANNLTNLFCRGNSKVHYEYGAREGTKKQYDAFLI